MSKKAEIMSEIEQALFDNWCIEGESAGWDAISKILDKHLPEPVSADVAELVDDLEELKSGVEYTHQEETINRAISALQSKQQPLLPEGYVAVPKEPTQKMVDAGYGALPDCACTDGQKWRAKLAYNAMLQAAEQNDTTS